MGQSLGLLSPGPLEFNHLGTADPALLWWWSSHTAGWLGFNEFAAVQKNTCAGPESRTHLPTGGLYSLDSPPFPWPTQSERAMCPCCVLRKALEAHNAQTYFSSKSLGLRTEGSMPSSPDPGGVSLG